MTSNLGSEMINDYAIGFATESKHDDINEDVMKGNVMDVLKKNFKPEFINRLDDIIFFHPLKEKEIEKIVKIQLDNVKKRLEAKKIKIDFSDKIEKHLAKVGYDPLFGARPLKRAIQREILDPLAMEIIKKNVEKNAKIKVDVVKNKVVMK
jgi:ATP-dependent Clp protease ATP-binding subunit ClpC